MRTNQPSTSQQDAVAMLAKRAVAGLARRREKTAVEGKDPIGTAFNWLKKHPLVSYPLAGGLGGAAIGGMLNMDRKKEDQTWLSSMATGALAGGGLGLGTAMLGTSPATKPYFGWAVPEGAANTIGNIADAGAGMFGSTGGAWDSVREHLFIRGVESGDISPAKWKGMNQEARGIALEEVAKKLQNQGSLPKARWQAARENAPLAAGAFGLGTGLQYLKTRPSQSALRAGLGTAYAKQTFGSEGIQHLSNKSHRQLQGVAWRGSRWNPAWFLNPNKPATTIPSTPPKFDPSTGKPIPGSGTPARPIPRGAINELGKAWSKGGGKPTWIGRAARGSATGAQLGLVMLVAWNMLQSANKYRDADSAQQFTRLFRSWDMPEDMIKQFLANK